MDFRYRKLEIIRTNNAVYTRVWPCIGASYNHLLREYKSIQCSLRCASKRNNITTSELLHMSSSVIVGIAGALLIVSSNISVHGEDGLVGLLDVGMVGHRSEIQVLSIAMG